MTRSLAIRAGCNYWWGLINFTIGCICGSFGFNFFVASGVTSTFIKLLYAIAGKIGL